MIIKATAELQKTIDEELKIPDPPLEKAVAILETSENDTKDSGKTST